MDILELQEEANTRMPHTAVAAKCHNKDFLCNCFIIDKKKLQMRSLSHVGLAYYVYMRRNITVNILFTSLTEGKHAILIILYSLAGCDIGSAFFGIGKQSVFKRMMQDALKLQGLEDLDNGPLSNCQNFNCTQFD